MGRPYRDPNGHTLHLQRGLFSRPPAPAPAATAEPVYATTTPRPVPESAVRTITGMLAWIGWLLWNNLPGAIPVTLLVIAVIVCAWRQERQY